MTPRHLAPDPITADAHSTRRLSIAPTMRAVALLCAGALWLIPAWFDPRAVAVMFAWNFVVAVAMILDARSLPPAGALRVTRRWGGALTLGAPLPVTLEAHNGGRVPVSVRLTDYLDPALQPELRTSTIAVAPHASASASMTVSPRARGDVQAGQVIVEWRSAWGLVERWAEAPLDQAVRVYPDLQEARRHSMYLVRSRQIAIERRRAKRAGGGREFDRMREYQPGDDLRDVSWMVSARRGRLVTRLYQPERSQTVWLLVDAGRLLRARAGGQTLLDRATTAGLAVAEVAMASGDRVGLIAYGRQVQHQLAPARGPAHLRRLIEALAVVRPETVEANHAAAAAVLRKQQKRRALIVWLTEVAETAGIPEVVEHATTLVPRHILLFVTMRQPEVAAVTAAQPSSAGEMYRVLAALEATDRRESLLRSLGQRGALILETSPAALAAGVVDRYLEVKERGMI